ncbi:hypothetical protein GOP47_0024385 [Adiantum capillus-veneris]|uniref:Aquaporin n=1 Tax=Adiantum capillus-veneris TaxID=13818 RepID=A0A9D4Z3M1_ADICA|nr:hypothetical protein GOP47_0024385 [Adiantum capillus-veneris]
MAGEEANCKQTKAVQREYSPLQKALAELIGTFFVVFVGCGGGVVLKEEAGLGHTSMAISSGVVVMIMIFCTAHISAAHLNPAVTLAFASAGLFPWIQVLPYILSQMIGSLLASLGLQLIVDDSTLFSLIVNQPLHHSRASFVMEVIATFALMLVNMKVSCHLGAGGVVGVLVGPFIIGTTVALAGLYAGPLCGGLSMNPARSIGPALVAVNFKSLHIFVIGPIIGALSSALIYNTITSTNNDSVVLRLYKHVVDFVRAGTHTTSSQKDMSCS